MSKLSELYENHKERFWEIIRFGITGGVSTITNYGVYWILLKWFSPTIAFTLGYIAAMIVNYLLTTAFTFKVKATAKNALGFLVSNGINYLLCTLFLNVFIWLGVGEKWAPIPMYAICIPINYLIVRFVMKTSGKYEKQ